MNKKNLYNLTNPQMSIWTTEQYYQGTSLNNISGIIYIEENANIENIKKAVNIYIKKNEAVRLRVVLENNIPMQYISKYEEVQIDVLNINKEDAETKSQEFTNKPFELIDSNLFKFKIYQFSNGEVGIYINLHHLIADAWSMSLYIDEVMSIYSKLKNNQEVDEEINSSYTKFIQKEQEYIKTEKYIKDGEFWGDIFKEEPKISHIKNSLPSNLNLSAIRKSYVFSKELYEKMDKYCKNNGSSIYTFLMSIYSIYLSKINNNANVIIGTPILNRTNFEEKKTSGMFISTVPFLANIQEDKNVNNVIKEISNIQRNIFRHQKYPYTSILDILREKYNVNHKLYDVALSYQNARDNKEENSIKYCTKWLFSGNCVNTLDIHFYDMDNNGIINIYYDYQIEKMTNEEIDFIHKRILYIINQVISENDIKVEEISIITEEEKNILSKFNDTNMEYPDNINVHEYIEKIGSQNWDKIAVVDNYKKITYKQLKEKSDIVAKNLLKNGVKSNDCVSILFQEKSVELIISMLGILKAGASFLTIYPKYPEDRINYIFENSKTKLLITEEKYKDKYKVNSILYSNMKEIECENLPVVKNTSNAYVIYTSGSTGKPKGITLSHKNLINFMYAFNQGFDNGIGKDDNVLSVSNVSFDASISEIYIALGWGATLFLYKDLNTSSEDELAKYIYEKEINFAYIPPALLQTLYQSLKEYKKIKFNKLFVGAEAINSNILKEYLTLNENMKIINAYGPSEATVCCTIYKVVKDIESNIVTPIGKPIGNTKIIICDKNKNEVPLGEVGEIYIKGDCVGNGYLNNPELNKDVFDLEEKIYKTGDLAKWLPNGLISFVGRNDNQIKYRGYRIDLGEIEATLEKIREIENSLVVLHKTEETVKLIAFIVTKNKEINDSYVREIIAKKIPHYMIPNSFIVLEKFPITTNGKIDKKLLLENLEKDSVSQYVKPRTESEIILAKAWEKVLKVKNIGIDDNFFEIGGDSLRAIKIATIAYKNNIMLTPQDFYTYPTIRMLSSNIDIEITKEEYKKTIKLNKDSVKRIDGNILLIGATGFLGAHLLEELLNTTDKKIYCIVRKTKEKTSEHRLKNRIEYYFNSKLDKYIGNRIQIIEGDFTTNKLGLKDKEYNELLQNIQTIINTAAVVKHIGEYNYFKKNNIDSVKYLIDICRENKNIRLVHISTLSVAGDPAENQEIFNYTEKDLYINQSIEENVYVKTKFKAEQLLAEAIEEGLNISVFRLGNISWRSNDGKFQINEEDNLFFNILKFFIDIKELPECIKNIKMNISPVDYCAKSIISILNKDDINMYHIYNFNEFTLEQIAIMLNELGHNIKFIDNKEFEQIAEEKVSSNPVYIWVSEFFRLKCNSEKEINIDSKITMKKFENLNLKWPEIDSEYIERKIGG